MAFIQTPLTAYDRALLTDFKTEQEKTDNPKSLQKCDLGFCRLNSFSAGV